MSRKEFALDAISSLPDECTLEEIVEHLRYLAAIQEGIEEIARGEVVPHEEVKRDIASWLSE